MLFADWLSPLRGRIAPSRFRFRTIRRALPQRKRPHRTWIAESLEDRTFPNDLLGLGGAFAVGGLASAMHAPAADIAQDGFDEDAVWDDMAESLDADREQRLRLITEQTASSLRLDSNADATDAALASAAAFLERTTSSPAAQGTSLTLNLRLELLEAFPFFDASSDHAPPPTGASPRAAAPAISDGGSVPLYGGPPTSGLVSTGAAPMLSASGAATDSGVATSDASTAAPLESAASTQPSDGGVQMLFSGSVVTVQASIPEVTEGSAGFGQFTVSRTGDLETSLVVNYTVSGTAAAESDYAVLEGSISLGEGDASETIMVETIDDDSIEGDETVIITLSAGTGYSVGSPDSATVTIADDDAPEPSTVTIAATISPIDESGTDIGQFTVSRSDGDLQSSLTVYYTVGGTASEGGDYTALPSSVTILSGQEEATIDVQAIDDQWDEGAETVVLTLSSDAAYTIGTPASATVTIIDDADDTLPVVSVTGVADGDEDGEVAGEFEISRTGDTTNELAVHYDVEGTATAGEDYGTPSGTATIPSGATTITVQIAITDDLDSEIDESVTLGILEDPDYSIGEGTGSTSILLIDNDPEVSIVATDPDATEAGLLGQFTVYRSGDTGAQLTVSYTVSGTAAANADYVGLVGTVIIPTESTSAAIIVEPIDDDFMEGDETVVVTLASGTGYVLGLLRQATVTIHEDPSIRMRSSRSRRTIPTRPNQGPIPVSSPSPGPGTSWEP